jgi:hypothetical protein
MTVNSATEASREPEKVVVHLEDGVVKGFLESNAGDTLDALLRKVIAAPPQLLRIRRLGEDTLDEIPVEKTKAIFYVKDFDGNPEQKALHFYKGAPIVHGIWIRLEFIDGEIMEGLVHNTLRFLVDPGFFMRPTDPKSNNLLVYVMKSWIKECRVLGLRNI